jgi:hypothetical protein
MSTLQRFSLGRRNLAPQFASNGPSEDAATHPDAAMNAPTIDSHACLSQSALPREDVCVDGIDECSVKIKN